MFAALEHIAKEFGIPGRLKSYSELTSGHVHRTYKVDFLNEDGSEKSYIVQRMNIVAFKNPSLLMDNIEKVTEYLRKLNPNGMNLHFHHTKENRKAYLEDETGFWRLFNYIPSRTFDLCSDLSVIRGAGQAFGEFQKQLKDFPAEELAETIPNFHNTASRFEALIQSAAEDSKHRFAQVQDEYNWYLSVREKACTLIRMLQNGELPLRVTHNDTKFNNVLFAQDSNKPLVVIDLDTVMPGLAAYDFGDAMRYAANTVEEDHSPAEDARVNLPVFQAFAEGFLEKTADSFTREEIDTLSLGAFVMTVECGSRFLADYLNGDIYFKTAYSEHNLVRARCQMALAKDMLKHEDEMNEIVHRIAFGKD